MQSPKTPYRYPVLARLSAGYSGPEGRLPTRYSPVRHCTGGLATPFSCDLHVLGTPPAFALSQDQTLREILKPRRAFFDDAEPDPFGSG
jgi:hypothetical protein